MIPKWYNGEVKFTVLSWNCFSYLLFVEYQPNRPWDIPILNNSGLYQCRLFSNYWNNNLLPSQQARLKGTCISEINANKYKKPGWIKKWNSWQEASSLQLFTNIDQERNSACGHSRTDWSCRDILKIVNLTWCHSAISLETFFFVFQGTRQEASC